METEQLTKEELIMQELNEKLANKLSELGVRKLVITTAGNSIASGYSFANKTIPLLRRNSEMRDYLNEHEIEMEDHNFSRMQNNNDSKINEWLLSNTSENDVAYFNRRDFEEDSAIRQKTHGITPEKIKEYWKDKENPKGFQDVVLQSGEDIANIIIYDGTTGSFLDGLTRGGSLNPFKGIKRDITSIEATLKYISANNRNNNTNTQIYLLGSAHYLGLPITEAMNMQLKELANKYPCAVYVEPINAHFFYKEEETNKLTIDVHYNEEGYRKLINKTMQSITNNYAIRKAAIEFDRFIYKLSQSIELGGNYSQEMLQESIDNKLNEVVKKLKSIDEIKSLLEYVRKYYKNTKPYDFYYLEEKDKRRVIL